MLRAFPFAAMLVVSLFGWPAPGVADQLAPSPAADISVPTVLAAARAGDARSQFLMGLREKSWAGGASNPAKAVAWFKLAAAQGHADAQFLLGRAYFEGDGIAQDLAKAADWYRKAARGGHVAAEFNLGLVLERGQGVANDAAAARKIYEKAAARGLPAAMRQLAVQYAAGTGGERDLVKALMWVEITITRTAWFGGSATEGDEVFRRFLAEQMNQYQIAAASDMALRTLSSLPLDPMAAARAPAGATPSVAEPAPGNPASGSPATGNLTGANPAATPQSTDPRR